MRQPIDLAGNATWYEGPSLDTSTSECISKIHTHEVSLPGGYFGRFKMHNLRSVFNILQFISP